LDLEFNFDLDFFFFFKDLDLLLIRNLWILNFFILKSALKQPKKWPKLGKIDPKQAQNQPKMGPEPIFKSSYITAGYVVNNR
jgi:hypothetical protein